MPETDDPCSPEILSSSGIAQRNDIGALRTRARASGSRARYDWRPAGRPGLLALQAAMNGSLCLGSNRLPEDFDMLTRRLRNAVPPATISVCLHDDDRVRDLLCRPLEIPSLAERASEADRIVQGTFDEAAETLGVMRVELSSRMRQCVVEHVASFAEVEKTARPDQQRGGEGDGGRRPDRGAQGIGQELRRREALG
jgi:hypothetical protein